MNAPTESPTVLLMVATRKGAWLLQGDPQRQRWQVDGPHFLGHTVSHLVLDPRDGRTLLAAVRTGHLGPTIFRSTDAGQSWKEATQPPAFAQPAPGTPDALPGRSVNHTFWLTPGHTSEPGRWYAGTSPQGLFRSDDGGEHWTPLPSVNDNATLRAAMGSEQDGTPDGPKLHSLIVDPRDPAHLVFGMSGGGVHESRDAGQTWAPLIDGLQVVDGFDPTDISCHDPHCLRLCPTMPDRLYQQNHCGIYRLDRPGTTWQRIGRAMPPEVGDIGFTMVVHPRDAHTAWVFPMDGTDVWPRTSPAGRPAAYVTHDAGASWQRQDQGLPTEQAWWTIKRQAMCIDTLPAPALYLGTTSGELWVGHDGGTRWENITRHLPEIYAVEVAVLG
ncbi:MAG: glycosyl hydrolase [Rubrivivax sp.]|nr:glycosyl hydrolase [Rubrivivax sp.]